MSKQTSELVLRCLAAFERVAAAFAEITAERDRLRAEVDAAETRNVKLGAMVAALRAENAELLTALQQLVTEYESDPIDADGRAAIDRAINIIAKATP